MPKRLDAWNPAIAVTAATHARLKARAESLGTTMSELITRLVNASICSVCNRAPVIEPGAKYCGAHCCALAEAGH